MSEYHKATRSLFSTKQAITRSPTQKMKGTVYSVAQIVHQVSQKLKYDIPTVQIRGEISSFKPWRTGHWYFNIQDDKAILPCVMFRHHNNKIQQKIEDGQEVILTAQLSLYEPQARFQATVTNIQPVGRGDILQELEALRKHFWDKGYCAAELKKALPAVPKHIALITSPQGAALHDMCRIFKDRRVPCAFSLFPCRVQGQQAPAEIVRAIHQADMAPDIDTIIIARGGGALEDLLAFSAQSVVESIHACSKPVIVGVGHETDRMIADDVADIRAATPTHAAETIAQHFEVIRHHFAEQVTRLTEQLEHRYLKEQERLLHLKRQLKAPWLKTADMRERLLAGQHRLKQQLLSLWHQSAQQVDTNLLKLEQRKPNVRIHLTQERLERCVQQLRRPAIDERLAFYQKDIRHDQERLNRQMDMQLAHHRATFLHAIDQLEARSPMQTLRRGFAHASNSKGQTMTSISKVRRGDRFTLRLVDGQITGEVIDLEESIEDTK